MKMYLDDWLNLNSDQIQCTKDTSKLVVLTQALGFNIKPEKCDFTPSRQFQYLGMHFDTDTFTVRPSALRIDTLNELLSSLLQKRSAPYRTLLSLLGKMESISNLLPLARVHKRPFQRELMNRVKNPTRYNQFVVLTPWFAKVTKQWTNQEWLNLSVPIQPLGKEVYLHTDASSRGWGVTQTHAWLLACGPFRNPASL